MKSGLVMCGILLSSRQIEDLEHAIKYLKRRGPDATSVLETHNFTFVHTLLSITGEKTLQPFHNPQESILVLYNGEIYNHREFGNFQSDGECLIPAYLKHGPHFTKFLDGEFAVVLLDMEANKLIFSTDVFSTKPLWFARDGHDFALSSYESSLNSIGFERAIQVEANSSYELELSTLAFRTREDVHSFCLNQHKSSYDDWNLAFEASIEKRTSNIRHGLFIGLSSGYDSGAIACALMNQNVKFSSYSIIGSEKEDTIRKRIELLGHGSILEISLQQFVQARAYLKQYSEEYKLGIDNGESDLIEHLKSKLSNRIRNPSTSDVPFIPREVQRVDSIEVDMDLKSENEILAQIEHLTKVAEYRKNSQLMTDDNGAIGLSIVLKRGVSDGNRIYLSGGGADEIFSDYGFKGVKHYPHSTIGGHFPDDLEEVFPWKNFFGNTQRAYLAKEEYVSGTFGVEGRYPFLDRMVVQEFLWLRPELKNQNYKSVIHQFLEKNQFPYDLKTKLGFNCGFTSNMGSVGPFSEQGRYRALTSVNDRRLEPHTEVGKAFDESRIINQDGFSKEVLPVPRTYDVQSYLFNL